MLQSNQRESGSRRIVVIGCGVLGTSLATSASDKGHSVHVLDPQVEAFEQLPPGKIRDGGIVPIVGDGTRQEDLLKVPVRDADVLMALTGSDTINGLAGQMAKHLHGVPTVICRIEDPGKQEMYSELGMAAFGATNLVAQMVLEAADV